MLQAALIAIMAALAVGGPIEGAQAQVTPEPLPRLSGLKLVKRTGEIRDGQGGIMAFYRVSDGRFEPGRIHREITGQGWKELKAERDDKLDLARLLAPPGDKVVFDVLYKKGGLAARAMAWAPESPTGGDVSLLLMAWALPGKEALQTYLKANPGDVPYFFDPVPESATVITSLPGLRMINYRTQRPHSEVVRYFERLARLQGWTPRLSRPLSLDEGGTWHMSYVSALRSIMVTVTRDEEDRGVNGVRETAVSLVVGEFEAAGGWAAR